jgi:hypothetical protein
LLERGRCGKAALPDVRQAREGLYKVLSGLRYEVKGIDVLA